MQTHSLTQLNPLQMSEQLSSSSLLPVVIQASNGGVVLKPPVLVLHARVDDGANVHVNVVGAQPLEKIHHLFARRLHTRQGDKTLRYSDIVT